MAKTDLAVLKYWRSSVADSAIGDACLASKMLKISTAFRAKKPRLVFLGRMLSTSIWRGAEPCAAAVRWKYHGAHAKGGLWQRAEGPLVAREER